MSSRRKKAAFIALALGAIAFLAAASFWAFGSSILDQYLKGKLERAVADSFPGFSLRIGNLLVVESVTVRSTNESLSVGWLAATGIQMSGLFGGKVTLAELLSQATLEATNLCVDSSRSPYRLRSARVQASVPHSELIAQETDFGPRVGDEEHFAQDRFRTTRYRVLVPECRVSGVAYDELLQGKSYRARRIHVLRPSLDALVNCDKLRQPHVNPPPMVHEALAFIPHPLHVDRLTLTNGLLRYGERMLEGDPPGTLTFGDVNLSVAPVANQARKAPAILLLAKANLMDAGMIKLAMSIPINPSTFSLHYSGSLSAMDLPRLNAFLDNAVQTRITSGRVLDARFTIDVTDGTALGRVYAFYENLVIAVLDPRSGSAKGLDDRIASLFANVLKVRNANTTDAAGAMKIGQVNYTRKPDDTFVQFAWLALRTGILDLIGH